jgi:hypothetical protein
MTDRAGFAIAGVVGEGAVNRALRALWANNTQPFSFALPPNLTVAGQPVSASGLLELLTPELSFIVRADRTVAVRLALVGEATWSAPALGVPPATALVLLSAGVRVGLTATVASGRLIPGLDVSQATVTSIVLQSIGGPTVPKTIKTALGSPQVLNGLQQLLQGIPPGLLQFPTASMPAAVALGPVTLAYANVAVIPLNQALAMAADLPGLTQGDPAQLLDFRTVPRPGPIEEHVSLEGLISPFLKENGPKTHKWADLAVSVDARAFLDFVNLVASPALPYGQFSQEVKLSNLNLSLEDYTIPLVQEKRFGFVLRIAGTKFGITTGCEVKFGIRLRTDPSGAGGYHFVVDQVKIDETIIVELVVGLAAALGLMFPILVPALLWAVVGAVDGIIPSLLGNIQNTVKQQIQSSANKSVGVGLGGSFKLVLPATTAPKWQVDVSGPVMSADALDSYASFGIDVSSPQLWVDLAPRTFLSYIDDDQFDVPQQLVVSGDFTGICRLNDPTVHVAWTVWVDGKARIGPIDRLITQPNALSFVVTPSMPALGLGDSTFGHERKARVGVRIYRPLGTRTDELFSGGEDLPVRLVLDRSRPYVQCDHAVHFAVAPHGVTISWERNRTSAVHRTAPAARCKNVVAAATAHPSILVYRDELPFPSKDADQLRHKGDRHLCDYCFFGGPNSHVLKP